MYSGEHYDQQQGGATGNGRRPRSMYYGGNGRQYDGGDGRTAPPPPWEEDRRLLSDRQLQEQLLRMTGGDSSDLPHDDPIVVLVLSGEWGPLNPSLPLLLIQPDPLCPSVHFISPVSLICD